MTQSDPCPLPKLTDQFLQLKWPCFFSQIDLNNGYYQISVAESDISKTVFILQFGHYEFLRMPFGLGNAQDVLTGNGQYFMRFGIIQVFLDDVLIFSRTMIHVPNIWR